MKKIKTLLLFSVLFLLSSCLPNTELSDRAVVEGIGIDYINGKYSVCVQYFDPSSADDRDTLLLQENGDTLKDALAEISRRSSRVLYFGHNNIIVIGTDAAKQDIYGIMNFFNRDRQTNSDIALLLTERAENVIRLSDSEQPSSPLSVLRIIQRAEKSGDGCEYRLYRLLQGYYSENGAYCLPFGTVNGNHELSIDGAGIFKKNDYTGTVSREVTRGIGWINGKMSDYTFSDDEMLYTVSSCESKVQAFTVNQKPLFRISIRVFLKSPPVLLSAREKSDCERTFAENVQESAQYALEKVVHEKKCDIFSLTPHVKYELTDYWKTHESAWISDLTADWEVTAICIIR